MRIKTILFDLDGTLLPMDQELFVDTYFKLLAEKLAHHGYHPKPLIQAIWAGTGAMVKNTGSCTNETVFWDTFAALLGENMRQDQPLFEEFYREDFQKVRTVCGFAPEAAELVHMLKEQGFQLVLATNPIFPAVATESRIRWAGLQPSDFLWVTTYENSSYSKPNPDYYREILEKLNLQADECLMVGNDAAEDLVAETLGMQVFLLTDCLINRENRDLTRYPQGGFTQLLEYVRTLS